MLRVLCAYPVGFAVVNYHTFPRNGTDLLQKTDNTTCWELVIECIFIWYAFVDDGSIYSEVLSVKEIFFMWFQVEYQCEGFLEKNKDTVFEEQINVLKSSKVTMDRLTLNRICSIKC